MKALICAVLLALCVPAFSADIIDYKTLCETDGFDSESPGLANFNMFVSQEIKKGWQPLGPVTCQMEQIKSGMYLKMVFIYCQALVKYKPEPKPTPTVTSTPEPLTGTAK